MAGKNHIIKPVSDKITYLAKFGCKLLTMINTCECSLWLTV